ncbi:hypothetical protein Y1Q_0006910 [Alligator mississippiensis]|uniref:Probable JmjC domain-containing histone demethylation protein 2C n=1 Tax=Alligator mississippiensis TaxID=8496 RepID=A0A151MUG9_ALLMI|nr:hypothetical protein Y1Q_0006910 [Alligator mississippiensis]
MKGLVSKDKLLIFDEVAPGPTEAFKPLVGKSVYNSITAVEFLVDKQLDFVTEDSAFQPYQDDVDSLNPVLRDSPQLHEEVKAWVKEQKVQEIFMQGPYSLNGYRVRVYRQDSATQWFTGIITHHDLFTRTMIVMNDQVLEPQNVDPSMVQMTFLDDVVHSLLKGENIGITSRRRSRSSQNSNTVHGHYTRAQANSPRPAMNSQTVAPKQNSHQQQRNARPNKRKGSDSSMPDEEKMKEEKYDYIGRGENPKSKNKHFLSKRRKPEEDEKKLSMKRLRTDNISDYSESSDSENSNKRLTDSSSEQNSENELKSKNTSKINGEEGKSRSSEGGEEQTLIDRQSPWDGIQEDKKHQGAERLKSTDLDLQEKSSPHPAEQPTVSDQNANGLHVQECNTEKRHAMKLNNEQFVPRPPTPKCVVVITNENNSDRESQENAASTFALQTVQKIESCSSDLKHQSTNANFLEVRKQETDQSWVSAIVNKMDLIPAGVTKTTSSVNEHLNPEKEKVQYGSFMSSLNVISLAEEGKLRKRSPAPDSVKSKSSASVDHPKSKPYSSPDVKAKLTQSPDTVKSKYPNGTHAYSGLGLPSSKWVHPETPVNAEASLRRNTPSPWLHQPTPVTSADSLGLLSHIPVRPSSADPHRPLKLTTHSSPPLSKNLVDHHKEELERKAFIEPLRSVTTVPVKTDLEQSRIQTAKESHLHRHFVDPMLNQLPKPPQETGERLNKYKEEHRRILQESIEVAPFTAKTKALEGERENYSRGTPLSSLSPKSHVVKYDKDAERSVSELYKMKHSVAQSLPQNKFVKEDKHPRRKAKRTYESGSESGDSDASESKSEQRTKRQPKPTYKKKQNDLQKRRGDPEEEVKPNGVLSRSAKEKSKLKLQSNSTGIPRSVLKDWRKVKKLKQTGESFLQDDSCSEIGPNLQKCRECRLIRSKKGEEPSHSPVFCRFYYFRRLSFSKNGVVRIDGFSSPDQYDDEAMSLWTHENYDDDELDLETSKYILDIIGDKFCQLVTSEKTAMSWVKKDAKIAWKRAVRGVREMCDACEATLFNIHWVCQKCGFVVCLDCYKAKERKSSRDKELYAWMKCVKGQPHDHKHLMPTQIIPGSVLTDLLDAMHNLKEKFEIKSHCQCTNKQCVQAGKLPAVNGVSQVLQNVLNHSNKISLCMPESQHQSASQKSETNGNTSPGSDVSTDSKLTPPESQSPLHWLADLAEQKAREEKKENKECSPGKHPQEERDQDSSESLNCKTSPPVSQNNEQGSTLRDLLTTTAGKLRLGSTDAGIAFAPVYSTGTPSGKGGRTMPNILDDIIASVVENKIPPSRTPKMNVKSEMKDEPKDDEKSVLDDCSKLYSDIPHSWLCDEHILWLNDHKNSNNWKLFKECWKQGKPVLVSGMHKKMNISLWKAESISLDFGDQQADILNCKDSIISNASVKEFWDGFEEVAKRQKIKNGETVVLKLKDWPSGEDFKAMMPGRYEDLLKSLPLPEYCSPEGKLNLASHLPGFFVRPDLGPRLCSGYGVAATKDHDVGTTNLHIEVSDVVNILVYVGIAKGNGAHSKSGILKKLEEEDLDDLLKKRLKDSSELPGALWHIYAGKDVDKIREFLQKIAKEQGLEVLPEHDPIRDQSWYVNKKLRQRLLEEYGVKTCTVIQFLGDAIILPAGALHQVQNFHSCIQVTEDFVSPEHLVQSFHLTQELRLSKEEINYDDKLQVKNILYHAVKEMVRALKIHENFGSCYLSHDSANNIAAINVTLPTEIKVLPARNLFARDAKRNQMW